MQHIIKGGVVTFDDYRAYLETIKDRLPPHVAAFATNVAHYSLDAHESLHDAWLIELAVRETGTGARKQTRATEIEIRLFGSFHDLIHVLKYTGVRRYEFVGSSRDPRGHGDLITHEVRLAADQASLIHEYLWMGVGSEESRMLIECADFTHEILPIPAAAS